MVQFNRGEVQRLECSMPDFVATAKTTVVPITLLVLGYFCCYSAYQKKSDLQVNVLVVLLPISLYVASIALKMLSNVTTYREIVSKRLSENGVDSLPLPLSANFVQNLSKNGKNIFLTRTHLAKESETKIKQISKLFQKVIVLGLPAIALLLCNLATVSNLRSDVAKFSLGEAAVISVTVMVAASAINVMFDDYGKLNAPSEKIKN